MFYTVNNFFPPLHKKLVKKGEKGDRLTAMPLLNQPNKRTVHYRLCSISYKNESREQVAHSRTLEELLEEVFANWEAGKSFNRRINEAAQLDEIFSTANARGLTSLSGCLCGTLYHEQIGLKSATSEKPVGALPHLGEGTIVNDDGEKRELATNRLYFAVQGNHVAYVADTGRADGRLECFLQWLLTQGGILDEHDSVGLKKVIANDVKDLIKKHGVKEVSIRKRQELLGDAISQDGEKSIFRILKDALLRRDPLVETAEETARRCCTKQDHQWGKVKSKLVLYLDKKDVDAEDLMNLIAEGLMENDEDSLVIDLNGDKQIKGNEVTLTGFVYFPCHGGITNQYEAMGEVAKWLTKYVESGSLSK